MPMPSIVPAPTRATKRAASIEPMMIAAVIGRNPRPASIGL